MLVTANHGILSALSRLLEGHAHKGARVLWPCADECVNYDVPGNIHYGWVGRAATILRWLLLFAANRVQKGGVDDPKDQNAIKIGMDLWDVPSKEIKLLQRIS